MTTLPGGLSSSARPNPVLDPAGEQVVVRPAHLDRQLRRTTIDPRYSDPHLEELVRLAAERARNQAMAEGYAAGWAQGRRAAAEQAQTQQRATEERMDGERAARQQQLTDLVATFAEQTRNAAQATEPAWQEVGDLIAEGCVRLAAAALDRELRSIDDTVATSLQAALRRLSDADDVVAHLNPADQKLFPQTQAAGIRLVADPDVPAGSVLVLTPAQRLFHHLPAALAAAEAVLRS